MTETARIETAGGPRRDERLARVGFVSRLLQRPEIGSLVGVAAVFSLFAATANGFGETGFGSLTGTARWSDEASNIGIMAVVVALLMIGGEFDLSAGVMVGSSGLLLGLLVTEADMNIWPAIVLVLLFGLTIGFMNGILVMKTRLPSFIVTLATFFVLRGLNLGGTLKITDRVYIENIDEAPGYDWARKIFGSTFWSPYDFQIRVVWWLVITVIATWLLTRTRVGNWIFAVGGDATAARNVGVPVLQTKIGLFIATSTTASVLGIMTAVQLRSIEAGVGIGREFEFIIAAVVGGCLLTGGYGSAVGASIGALIMGMAIIGIPFSGWDSDWQYLFLGIILLLAVLLNTSIRRRAERARV
jgi:simple sugar transport system permease protein